MNEALFRFALRLFIAVVFAVGLYFAIEASSQTGLWKALSLLAAGYNISVAIRATMHPFIRGTE